MKDMAHSSHERMEDIQDIFLQTKKDFAVP